MVPRRDVKEQAAWNRFPQREKTVPIRGKHWRSTHTSLAVEEMLMRGTFIELSDELVQHNQLQTCDDAEFNSYQSSKAQFDHLL